MVSLDAVTALQFLVVDLGLGVALRADSSDKVESRQASAGADGGVPHLVGLAARSADAVGGIVGLGGRADSAAVSDQVVTLPTLTSSVDPLLVGVAGGDAETQTEEVSLIADTLLGDGGVGGVEGAGSAGSISQLVVLGEADTGLRGDIVDPSGITGDSADAQTLVVDLVPVTLSADALDGVVSGDAAALTIGKNLIDSTADHAETFLVPVSRGTSTGSRLGIESGVSGALGADSVDDIVALGTTAGVIDAVVDLVGETGDAADLEGDIEEGAGGTGLADASDQVESLVADALLVNIEHVGSAGTGRDGEGPDRSGGAGGDDAVAIVEGVSLDTVTVLGLGVVDGEGGAATALSVDGVETRVTDTGHSGEVQHFIESAGGPAETKLGIVVLGGGTVGADALDQIVSFEADTDVVDQSFVEGAGGHDGDWGGGGRDVGESAGSVDQDVSGDAETGEGG